MNKINQLFSCSERRGRLQYLGWTASVTGIGIGAMAAGVILGEVAPLLMLVGFIPAMVMGAAQWWLAASRLRDMGWNVPGSLIMLIAFTAVGAITKGQSQGALIVIFFSVAIQIAFGLCLLFWPTKEVA